MATELAQGFTGLLAFSCMLLAPGYLAGRILFPGKPAMERALWSVALSIPLAIAITALLGRILPPSAISGIFLLADIAALPLLWISRARISLQRSTRVMLVLMALFGIYCVLAVTDIQIGHRLYVSTVIADWSVRVSMVEAAMRSGVPPINGLSALGGHAAPLRYYYFWYVLVAQMARTFHLSAHAALAASCAWAGWAFLAAAFLALKHMLGIRERLREKCFLSLLVGAVLGLDILPTALLWLAPKLHPYPEMEYWHQDRTPSFLGAVLYAPHHIAAFCSLLTGFLVLLLAARGEQPKRWPQLAAASLFAGIAFAASAGTSLFPTFCFVFVLSLWAIDLLRRREWTTVLALAASGAIALALAHGYLQDLSAGSSAATGFASLRWRNGEFIALQVARHHLARYGWLLRQPAVLVMDFFDLGFYTLVLLHQVRGQLLRKGRLTAGQCAVWALVLGAAVPFFLLSSTATSGPNDLGVDAGFLLRFGLQLWAVPWVWELWQQRHATRRVVSRAVFASAAVLFALGLTAQAYQVISERFYYATIGANIVHKQMDSFTQDRMPERMYNIRSALREFDNKVPPSTPDTEAIQFNPVGAMLPAEVYYNTHQIAAWDTGCGTSYGGDYKACAPIYRGLLFLYGNTQAGVDAGRAENDRQDAAAPRVANAADFAQACYTLHVRAIVAESTDSIWAKPDSWVWTEPAIAANETVRVLGCPVASEE